MIRRCGATAHVRRTTLLHDDEVTGVPTEVSVAGDDVDGAVAIMARLAQVDIETWGEPEDRLVRSFRGGTLRLVAHPQMFDDDDPVLARVRVIAGEFPGADQKVSHGRPAFFTKKVFAYYGGSRRVDGDWVQHPRSLVVLVDSDEREALLQDPRVYVPAYLGPSGWLGIDLVPGVRGLSDSASLSDRGAAPDWDEVRELLDASYRLTAGKRLVAELDAHR